MNDNRLDDYDKQSDHVENEPETTWDRVAVMAVTLAVCAIIGALTSLLLK